MNIDLAISTLYSLQVSLSKEKLKVGELLDLLGKKRFGMHKRFFFSNLIPLNLDLQRKHYRAECEYWPLV